MLDADWELFTGSVPVGARLRLTVVLEHFCDGGFRDLPRGSFRWLSRSSVSSGSARQGAFEARGTVVRGHATDRVFFVTSIEADPTPPPSPGGRRPGRGDHGLQLPLAFITPTNGE